METILVTTDLSANSKSGIRFAVQLSKQLNAQLIFYYVSEVTKPTSWSAVRYKEYEQENVATNTERLKAFVADTLGNETKPMDATYLVELGFNVDERIILAARKHKAAFICMSTRGAGKLAKIFGTNASTIITHSPVPVIVVPKNYHVHPIHSLFFACDFSSFAKEMKTVQAFADKLSVKTQVFHYDYLLHVPEQLRKLERKAKRFASDKISFHFRRMEVENTLPFQLDKDLKKEKSSLLILFTKQNRGWLDRLILPGNAAEMSFHSTIPLLTFRKK